VLSIPCWGSAGSRVGIVLGPGWSWDVAQEGSGGGGRSFSWLVECMHEQALPKFKPHTSYWHIHTEKEKKKQGKMRIMIRHKRTRTSPVTTGPSMLLQPQAHTMAPSHARSVQLVQCASACSAIRSNSHVNARGAPWAVERDE
jgi:hypothetical protein